MKQPCFFFLFFFSFCPIRVDTMAMDFSGWMSSYMVQSDPGIHMLLWLLLLCNEALTLISIVCLPGAGKKFLSPLRDARAILARMTKTLAPSQAGVYVNLYKHICQWAFFRAPIAAQMGHINQGPGFFLTEWEQGPTYLWQTWVLPSANWAPQERRWSLNQPPPLCPSLAKKTWFFKGLLMPKKEVNS